MPMMVFIEPKAPNVHTFSDFPLPRLGALILGTIMKRRGWDVEVYIEDLRRVDYEMVAGADLVGISTITSTAPRAYAIADKVRAMGIPVLMGGPHVTFLPDEALEHADVVVRGEGERTLAAFVDAWEREEDYSSLPGLSLTVGGRAVHNPARPPEADLDGIPAPDLSLLKRDPGRRAFEPPVPVLTSRGCPFDCSFCSVTAMFGKGYRFRSTGNIMAELREYARAGRTVFFYDDNFAANRARAKDLLRAIIAERLRFEWSTQVRADVARDPELVRLMKKAGCHTLYIGFESVNPRSLDAMKKRQTLADLVEAVRVLRRHRILIHGMFVLGFDDDDWETVKRTVAFAKKARLSTTQFLILTPIPGSELFDRMRAEERLQFRDWGLYDAHHVVFRPARLTLFDLQKAQILCHKKFYSVLQSARKALSRQWLGVAIAHYARRIQREWTRRNKTFMKAIKLLRPRPGVRISVDYREEVKL